ncbi:MAG: hypothetical protein ACOWWM_12710 [Desulfobacterales bacterium]
MAFPEYATLLDDFTGSNGDPLGANWLVVDGAPKIWNNCFSGDGTALWAGETYDNFEIVVSYGPLIGYDYEFRVYFRVTNDLSDGYFLRYVPGSGLSVWKLRGGWYTALVGSWVAHAVAAHDKYGIKADGSTIEVYHCPAATGVWSLLFTRTDSEHDAGRIGLFSTVNNIDHLDNFAAAPLTIPDTTPPTVEITDPASDTSTYDTWIDLYGTASDDVGVNRVEWHNAATDEGDLVLGTTTWLVGVPLAMGPNLITITAYDGAENSSNDQITVTRLDDTTPPEIHGVTPADGATSFARLLDVAGAASDNVEVDRIEWESHASGASGTAAGTVAWSISDIVLLPGENRITITAHDTFGNSASVDIVVTYIPVPASDRLPSVSAVTLTGAPDGVADVELAARSASVRIESGGRMRIAVQCVYSHDVLRAIADRPAGEIVISAARMFMGQRFYTAEIARAPMTGVSVEIGRGLEISGADDVAAGSGAWPLSNLVYRNDESGESTLRMSEFESIPVPGDTVTVDGEDLTIHRVYAGIYPARRVLEIGAA